MASTSEVSRAWPGTSPAPSRRLVDIAILGFAGRAAIGRSADIRERPQTEVYVRWDAVYASGRQDAASAVEHGWAEDSG